VKYLEQYQALAATGKFFRGSSLSQHTKDIRKLIDKTKSTTLLDWGCGAASEYRAAIPIHKKWGIKQRPTLYDPAFEKFSTRPTGSFHGVICTDVLEHVPEEEVDALVLTLFDYAERFVFASVCCRPASKFFDDGTNMHVTVKPYQWWKDKFEAANFIQTDQHGKSLAWVLKESP